MNPLTAHPEKKQPPLIVPEEAEEDLPKKRPFSNCLLFVLLAVFVFALACFAVYTAVAMGVPVEKIQPVTAKSEALSKNELSERTRDLVDEINNLNSGNVFSEAFEPSFRFRIFLKGKGDPNTSGDDSGSEESTTVEKPVYPKNRFIFRKIIIHNSELDKPVIDSSEEVSVRSDEGIKEVVRSKSIDRSNFPSPLDVLFNILNFPISSNEGMDDAFEKLRNEQSNVVRIEQNAKMPLLSNPKKSPEIEVGKTTNQSPETVHAEQIEKLASARKPSSQEFEKAKSSLENGKAMFNPLDDLANIISDYEHKGKSAENERSMIPNVFPQPTFFRIIRFRSPHSQLEGSSEMSSPMHQRYYYPQNYSPFPNHMMRSPTIPSYAENKASSKIVQSTSTRPPTTYSTRPTFASTQAYKHEPTEMPVVSSEGNDVNSDKFRENTPLPVTEAPKQIDSVAQKVKESSTIDRINTENLKPFENFLDHMLKA